MRLTLIITCILMVSVPSFARHKKSKHALIHVISKRMDIFYFKVDKEIIGAEIEVYADNGDKVATDTITSRHALIDFFYENPGHFMIKIKKGEFQQSFDYNKNTPSALVLMEIPKISVVKQ